VSIDPKIIEIARSYPQILAELEAMDTASRRGLDQAQRREKMPYHYQSSTTFDEIWLRLARNEIDTLEALSLFTKDMARYYSATPE
jgi:hypothetical protein